MSHFLAIDAGGTKTDYLIADEAGVLARVRSSTIKRLRVDAETAAKNLDGALRELSALSGVPLSQIVCTCVGASGATVPVVADWLRQELTSRVAGRLVLLGDVEIALDAAFPGEAGVLVLAGTGSNVAGRLCDGSVMTAGGWGPVLADQGSGHRIGVEALRAVFLAQDEGRSTFLLPAILGSWELDSPDALVAFANGSPAPDFACLVELVVQAAQGGDEVARSVLQREGQALGYLVRLLIRRMRAGEGTRVSMPRIAFAGSIMGKVPAVREALIEDAAAEFPGIATFAGVVDPIQGALWRARCGS